MRRLLILSLVCWCSTASLLYAQVPKQISIEGKLNFTPHVPGKADMPCNSAGTFLIGQPGVNTQSNDLALPIIYLCKGDSIFINHNGDADLSGDPVAGTPPGVAWAIYRNAPVAAGDNLTQIVTTEINTLPANMLAGSNGLPVLAFGEPDGDIWFRNFCYLQDSFNNAQPGKFFFAPITVDNFDDKGTWESAQVGFPPGPCVNVNIADAFEVVYLNPITIEGVNNASGDDCVGSFVVRGGLPQYDKDERYTIDIFLASDPTVKALIYTSVPSYQHGSPIAFSVTQPGQYTIRIEDGRSCDFEGSINMAGCVSSDNLIIHLPDTIAPPGTKICIPIKVDNFSSLSTATFTLEWDETVLQYANIQGPNPATFFNPINNLNESFTGEGKLGFIFFRNNGIPITIPDGGTLITVCFDVIGDLLECSPLDVTNDPSAIGAERNNAFVGITVDTGKICVNFLPLTLDLAVINPTCTGQATLQAIPNGGNDPYDISWTALTGGGAPGSGSVTTQGDTLKGNLTQNGLYEVCVTDQEGARLCDTIEMNVPILGANLSFEQPKCFGDSTGTVTANVLVNGVAVPDPSLFKYDWAPAGLTIQNVPVQTNVPAGSYSVTVTEPVSGCFHVSSGTMGSPAPVSDQLIDIMQATCTGVEDGTVSYIAEGGTAFPGTTYQFDWSYSTTANGTFTPFLSANENPSVLNSRASGYYRVTITDANGCTFTDDFQITNQRTVSITLATIKNVSCAGGADGSIGIAMTSTPPANNPTYAFLWVPTGPWQEVSTATTSTLSNLAAGTYGLTAIEGTGCVDTATFTITEPPALTLDTVDLKNPTCLQPNSGAITVSVTGGSPTSANVYSMLWNTPLPSGNSIYTQAALTAGTYSVTAVDSKGCRDSLMLTLSLPTPPVIQDVLTTAVKCGGDGCLEVVTNATGPTFSWNILDSTQVLGTSAKICGLDGGFYVVTLKDANSCVTVDTFSLTSVVPISIDTATLNIPKCFGDANGSIIPTISGGQPTYTYKWNTVPPSVLPALNQIKAGQYTLTVTDLKGCTDTETFDLPNPPSINAFYTDAKPATCSDTCNGAATIVVNYSNGTAGDFVFQWSGTPASTDSVRTDLCPGMYTVTVVATVNSCSRLVEVLVGSPQPITTTALDSVSVTCNGDNDGEASIAVAGGTSPYKFNWSAGGQTPVIKNLEAGPYSVTVTDKNNCTKVFSLTVPEPDPVTVTPDLVDQPKCFGNADGSLSVDVTGGNGAPLTYNWVKEPSTQSIGNTEIVNFLRAGYYSVTVTDTKGCTGSLDSLLLSDPAPVLGAINDYEALKCFGDETLISIDSVTGGSGAPYQYSVDNGATLPIDVPFTIGGGIHTITYSDRLNCEYTDTITIPEPVEITVKFIPEEVEIELGDSLELNPLVTGAAITSILWAPADIVADPDTLFTYAKPIRSTMLTLTVSDSNGCTGIGKVTILVDPNRNVYVPNAFKPGNPAGTNYTFNPWVGNGVKDINFFQVWDRWGELLYERTNFYPGNDNFGEGWDGRYNGDFVNPGVYIYVIEVDFIDGRTLLYRGDVTVVR